ncbi:MAG: DciA family protein [Hyphomicrobiales bacterium]|nr:DciA family protein [Hyphomicrobiales bacterium]
MAGKRQGSYPVPLGDVATTILDPVMRKRAGMSTALLQCWGEIAGERLAANTRPERIAWPRRAYEDDPFEPATLIIACEGAAALRVQHQTAEIISRANAFLGFAAIGRIKIVQKRVMHATQPEKPSLRALTDGERAHVASSVEPIANDALRASLERLGRSVLASRRPK